MKTGSENPPRHSWFVSVFIFVRTRVWLTADNGMRIMQRLQTRRGAAIPATEERSVAWRWTFGVSRLSIHSEKIARVRIGGRLERHVVQR